MTLNHLNLSVPDVGAASAFFADFFGLRRVPGKGREGVFAMLEDDAGLMLVLSNFSKDAGFDYPRDFHIGFSQESAAQVDALYERLAAAGYAMDHPPRKMWDAWRFYVRACDTLLVEVSFPLTE